VHSFRKKRLHCKWLLVNWSRSSSEPPPSDNCIDTVSNAYFWSHMVFRVNFSSVVSLRHRMCRMSNGRVETKCFIRPLCSSTSNPTEPNGANLVIRETISYRHHGTHAGLITVHNIKCAKYNRQLAIARSPTHARSLTFFIGEIACLLTVYFNDAHNEHVFSSSTIRVHSC
jgi:hypothetical protein